MAGRTADAAGPEGVTAGRVRRPEDLGLSPKVALPRGTIVELDPDTRTVGDGALYGGSPGRLLRLSPTGARALAELRAGPVASAAAATLARRLTDAGLGHPRPGTLAARPSVTVVVPVRDRAAELDRCLRALGRADPVVVVDDGSVDPAAVAAAGRAHGVRLLRRPRSGGPGAARNTALATVDTELVAFVDSDCVVPEGWVDGLVGHLADPLVVAVAPRVTAAGPSLLGSPLDLGDRPGRVAPLSRLPYVPTAALLARREALGSGFDEALRYGEDVDLVWRLLSAGWRVRYEPAVRVLHHEPTSPSRLLRRRFHYGTSAAPLAQRHPGQLSHLTLAPAPALTVGLLLARRPLTAAAAFGVGTALLARRLRRAGVGWAEVVEPSAAGVGATWLGIGRWSDQFALPALALLLAHPGPGSGRTRLGRRAAVASLLLGPPLAEWRRRRPRPPLARFGVAYLLDQAAYGAGVYTGCRRQRLWAPVRPSVVLRWPGRPSRS